MAITLRNTKGSALTYAEMDANFSEVQTLMDKAYVSVTEYGAVGDGVTDDSAAFSAAWAYLVSSFNQISANNPVVSVSLIIPPGYYYISHSINFTAITAFNISVFGYGAVLLGNVTDGNVIDATDTRGLHLHGLTIYGDATNAPNCGILIGPESSLTCGNNAFYNVKCLGYYKKTAFWNLGSETTNYRDCYFTNSYAAAETYGYIADGMNRLGATSAFTTLRNSEVAVSFTNNGFFGCRFANYATDTTGGSFYGEAITNWTTDKACYFLAFTGSNVKLRQNTTYRNSNLSIEGLFETTQTPGVENAIEFIVPNGQAADINVCKFNLGSPHASVSAFTMSDPSGGVPGALTLVNASIEVANMTAAAATPLFDNCETLKISGEIKTKAATTLNLADIAAFNGVIYSDDYSDVPSALPLGAALFFGKDDNKINAIGLGSTFTPTVTFATAGDLSVSYAQQHGWIYEFGNIVNFIVHVTFTPTYTTASGEFRIAGLPYSTDSDTYKDRAFSVEYINSGFDWPTSATQVVAYLPENATNIRLMGHGNGISSTAFTVDHVPSGTAKAITISGTYIKA